MPGAGRDRCVVRYLVLRYHFTFPEDLFFLTYDFSKFGLDLPMPYYYAVVLTREQRSCLTNFYG